MRPRLALVLLIILTSCAQFGPRQLPPIPSTLQTAYGPIAVEFIDSLVDESGHQLMGAFAPGRWKIFINRNVTARPVQWAVLFHEQCHVELLISGLRNVIDDRVAQMLCDLWALRELRRSFGPR